MFCDMSNDIAINVCLRVCPPEVGYVMGRSKSSASAPAAAKCRILKPEAHLRWAKIGRRGAHEAGHILEI